MSDKSISEVNEDPPADGQVESPPTQHYECPKGHAQEGEEWSYSMMSKDDGSTIATTGPLCQTCFADPDIAQKLVDFAREHIGTSRVAPPKAA